MLQQAPALHGHDLFGQPLAAPRRGAMSDRFLVPPFSVFNAREGYWQERKRAWIAYGIQSELGRSGVTPGGAPMPLSGDYEETKGEEREHRASIFDPVLCELAYRWFCPAGGRILDPFAGGSVRGVVAGLMGRRYLGIELRPEQVEANELQADAIFAGSEDPAPLWYPGDSSLVVPGLSREYDFLFSCPPFGDLERYSDDPADLSTMSWEAFLAAYREIIAQAAAKLQPDRFACFVVGDFRDERGRYRNFPGATIDAFLDAGLSLYNEAILITSVGSLPIRIGHQFLASRKLGKTHQNVLVFARGDGKRAAAACEAAQAAQESRAEAEQAALLAASARFVAVEEPGTEELEELEHEPVALEMPAGEPAEIAAGQLALF